MKKLFSLFLFLSLLTLVACAPAPKADLNLEKQIQKEEYEFETALGKLITYLSSIKHPNDVGINSIFPSTWLVEAYESGGSNLQWYGIAMPVPKDVGRGLASTKMETNRYYVNRGGALNPNTNLYIAPAWTGQPFNWDILEGGFLATDPLARKYPWAERLDCFKSEKVIKQPYMVPAEATYGVYLESHKKLSTTSVSNLVNIVQQIQGANPYKEKTYSEQLRTPSMAQLLEQLPPEAAKIGDDADTLIGFATTLDTRYFSKNSSIYDKQNALTSYTEALRKTKLQLSGIGEYIQPIKQWDFSSLEKYRALKKK